MAAERVVVVGAGGISGAWLPALVAEKLDVAAVVDLKLEAARQAVAKYGLAAEATTDLAAALRRLKPDLVLDLTVPEAHAAVTCAALKAGCHVLGEKPMAASMAEARRMVRAARRARRLYMVSQSRRWDARHVALRRAVADGLVGPVTTVNCDFYLGAHFGGFRDRMPSPLILDMAIHHFDLVRMITAADPVSVYAHEFNPRGSWYRGDAAASCIFEMTRGLVFTYRGSWCAEGCHTSWNGDWRIVGTRGTIVYERDGDPRGQVVAGTTGFHRPLKDLKLEVAPLEYPTMHGALREMLGAVRTGRRPQTDCRDNIKSLAMVFAALESSRRRRPVQIRQE